MGEYGGVVVHLHQLWVLDLHSASFGDAQLFIQLDKPLVSHHHLHLLFGSPVSMANDANHTTQLIPSSECTVDPCVCVGVGVDPRCGCVGMVWIHDVGV